MKSDPNQSSGILVQYKKKRLNDAPVSLPVTKSVTNLSAPAPRPSSKKVSFNNLPALAPVMNQTNVVHHDDDDVIPESPLDSAPEPSVPSHSNVDAKRFLADVRSSLSPRCLALFKKFIAEYSKKEITLDQLITKLSKEVFQGSQGSVLMDDFKMFIKDNRLPSSMTMTMRESRDTFDVPVPDFTQPMVSSTVLYDLATANNIKKSMSAPPPPSQSVRLSSSRALQLSTAAKSRATTTGLFERKRQVETDVCLICGTVPNDPARAPCGHIACSNCWKNRLNSALSCPCGMVMSVDDLCKL